MRLMWAFLVSMALGLGLTLTGYYALGDNLNVLTVAGIVVFAVGIVCVFVRFVRDYRAFRKHFP